MSALITMSDYISASGDFAKALKKKATTEVTMEVTMKVKRLVFVITGDHYRRELQEKLGLKNADHFRKAGFRDTVFPKRVKRCGNW